MTELTAQQRAEKALKPEFQRVADRELLPFCERSERLSQDDLDQLRGHRCALDLRDARQCIIALLDLCDRLEKERDEAREVANHGSTKTEAEWERRGWALSEMCIRVDEAKTALAAEREHASALAAALERALGLARGDASNAIYNLEGALEDLDRLGADRVCRSTIRRVGGQLAEVASVLDAHRARKGGDA